MSTITVRIDPKLKKLMKKYSYINWSEVVRKAIIDRLMEEKKKNVLEAFLINEELGRQAPQGWNSAKVIRKWRRR